MSVIQKTLVQLADAWEDGAILIWATMRHPTDTARILVFVTPPHGIRGDKEGRNPEVWDVG